MAVLLVASAWTIHTAWDQHTNDAGLIAAIRGNDADAVRNYLIRGASPDARENLAMNGSLWSRLTAFLLRKEVPGRDAQDICKREVIAYKILDGRPPDPIMFRNLIAIYELITQAKCQKHPGTCGPAVK
jgi:hypothetical protein